MDIRAYVIAYPPECDLLLGTDMLRRITREKPSQLMWETFYTSTGTISVDEDPTSDHDDSPIGMRITKQEDGRFLARLPLLKSSHTLSKAKGVPKEAGYRLHKIHTMRMIIPLESADAQHRNQTSN
ncbi:hypothetical protein BLOT_009588 [Blomia tropicalis]|nr:hypothetical protein BLOT_009588 [Blomia tropicalis]